MRCNPLSTDRPDASANGGNFGALIRHYRRHHRPRTAKELKFFETMSSFELAVHHATLAIDRRGKRFGHQCRIPLASLKRAKVLLEAAIPRLKGCTTFHELHSLLLQVLGGVHGLGELYVYDTALRLGASRGRSHYPEFIYLHRGTRLGARVLGLAASASYIARDQLPAPLRTLEPFEAEDFLCIYRDQFRNVKANPHIHTDDGKTSGDE